MTPRPVDNAEYAAALGAAHDPVALAEDPTVAVADALRRVQATLAGTAPSAEAAAEAVALLDRAAARLAGAPAPAEAMAGFLRRSPLTGAANPLAPPLRPRVRADGVVEATVELGELHEGPPGHVHGGIVAALFDEVLGFAESLTEQPGMTGRLTIAYRAPTPLHVPLTLRGWVDAVEGRRILARGTLHHGETLCAEADGLFVQVPPERFTELGERGRDRRRSP